MNPADILLVMTTCPDRASADTLAARLVETRLAACINILSPCQSVYHWKGAVERGEEIPLLIKTTAARYPEVEAAIRDLHPYELPEILALPVAAGFAPYLDWIGASVRLPETC